MRKDIYLSDDKRTRSLLRQIDDEMLVSGDSFSEIVRKSLEEHSEKKRNWVQAKLTDYQSEFATKLEIMHRRFIEPNPERYPDWRAALKANDLLMEPAIEYSRKRGWKV